MTETDAIVNELKIAIKSCAARLAENGFYMPAVATLLRIEADRVADLFPDDTNGGKASQVDDVYEFKVKSLRLTDPDLTQESREAYNYRVHGLREEDLP